MRTVAGAARQNTQSRPDSVQMHTRPAFVQDADRERAGMAFRLTLALSGVNEKQAAAAMEKDRTTVNRWCNGKVDTAAVRFRRYLRRLVQGGAFPVAILADVASEIWSQSVRDWTPEEMMARKHDLHRAETEAQGKVDVWQMDDRAGVAPECENQVDAAILEHATRLIELYVLRCELRLGRSS